MSDRVVRDTHLNLVDSSAQLFELDGGAVVERGAGWVFGAGSASHPLISNAAFRTDDDLDPGELVERARSFFSARGRGFAVWIRTVPEDEDLEEAAVAAGLQPVHESPAMVLHGRAEERPLDDAIELRRVGTDADAADYWRVATESFAEVGFPPEVFAHYDRHDGFRDGNVAAFLARRAGEPVGISMAIASHGVAGVYWVGTTAAARGLGLGRAMTAAAVNAGLEIGGETASLQATSMGEPVYRRMGFETIYDYRLFLSPAPSTRI